MKHFVLFVISFSLSFSSIIAQDLLVFPESGAELNAMPLDACVRHSSNLMKDFDNKDISKAEEFRQYGLMLLHLGQHEYSKEIFEKALELNNEAYGKEDIRYVKALIDLARAYMLLIRYSEAAGMYEEALATTKKILGEDSKEYLSTLNETVLVHTRVQNWAKAIAYCQMGITFLEKNGKTKGIEYAVFQNNLGGSIKNTYNYASAINSYEKAIKLVSPNPRIAISVAANLAEVYALVGRVDEAKKLVSKYKPVAEKILLKNDLNSARTFNQFGAANLALKDFDAAETCFKQAFVTNSLTFSAISSIPDQADDLMFKNDFLATCGQAGIMIYSIEMYKQRYDATGDLAVLKDGYKVANAMIKYGEKLMNSYLSEENKLILFRLGAGILFDRSIFFAYELYKKTNEEQYIEDAFFYSERSKSTLLLNALRSKENKTLLGLPADMLEKEKTNKAALKTLQKKQIEAETEEEKNKIQQSINDLNIKIAGFKEELLKRFPDYYQHRYDIKLSDLKSVQAFLAKKNNVLIEYALGLEKHYAFVVTKNSLDMVQLDIDYTEIRRQTVNMRKTLTNYRYITKNIEKADSLFTVASRYFYETFLTPVLGKVEKEQHLLIVPDQQLGHLPFETFLTALPSNPLDFANYPYLIKDYPISYSYSATILLGQQRHQKTRSVTKRGVLAFAAEYPKIESNSFSHQRGGGIGVVREGLQPLPGAKEEVEMMSENLFGEFYHGLTANEETFKKNAHYYGIIHLAMHGVLDNKNPILSSLVFSEDSSATEDNFLRAYEIAQLDLNADLVVLSACETGYGKFTQGEGVMSLAHSFSYAGASSVLMSLWQVNDFSTSQIMKDFYKNLAKGFSKEVALREAKLTYLSNPENGVALHPAFWAAFVQTGDVQPLDLVAKSGRTFKEMAMMMTVGGVLLLLLIGFGVRRFSRRNKS